MKWLQILKLNKTGDIKSVNEIDLTETEIEPLEKFKQVIDLFTSVLKQYNSVMCQCAYPRFQQIVGIDCSGTGKSFKCHDTDLLIDISKQYFDVVESGLTDECTNQKWICKKCGSTYEYGWSDFSIYIERQKLRTIELKTRQVGKAAVKPIPLYLGLVGHSYPSYSEIKRASFTEFKSYMTEL